MTNDSPNAPASCGQHELVDCREYWETTAVTALAPGWVNVFGPDTVGGMLNSTPAPALLTQTRVFESSIYQDRETGKFSVHVERQPATRVVFAQADCGQLEPAADDPAYIDSMTCEQFADMLDAHHAHMVAHHPEMMEHTNGHNGGGDGAA